jgi:hypothetical protein
LRKWLTILLLLLPTASVAQTLQITAVTAQVKDLNNALYSNCQWSVVFVGQNTQPVGPYQPQNLLVGQQGTCDSLGNLNVNLADNIVTVTPTPSQWQFNICSAAGYLGGPFCFTKLQTVTGVTQNLTSTFQALAPLLPTTGGGGTGNVSTTPTSSQNILQPPGTQFSATDISNIQYAETSYNWSQTPSGTLTGGSPATVTLTPCPAGIWGTDTIGVIYVSGVGTPEPVHLTGSGSCTPGAASGTVNFTPVNSHGGGYTIGSASSGIYETIAAHAHFGAASGNVHVQLKPAGTATSNVTLAYPVQGTIVVPTNSLFIDGQGAVLLCATRDYCVAATPAFGPVHINGLRFASTIGVDGWSVASTQCLSNVTTITTTAPHTILVGDTVDVHDTDNSLYWGGSASLRATVTAVTGTTVTYPQNCGGSDVSLATTPGTINIINAAFLADTNSGDTISDATFTQPGGVVGHFSNDVVVLNDQEFNETRAFGANIGSATACTPANPYCGAAVYAPGPFANASIIHLEQDDFSLNCGGNGIVAFNGNTVSIKDSVVQAYKQTGIFAGVIRGGFGPLVVSNVYTEASVGCLNPNYSGSLGMSAGLNVYGIPAMWDGGEGAPSTIQQAFATGGATTYYYYVIAHDSIAGTTIPLQFGLGSTATTQLVQWPRIVSTVAGTITYDIVRQASTTTAPTTANCTGGSTSACGSVTTAVAQCAGLICSFTDDVTVATTAITILSTPTFLPRTTFWPFNFLQGGAQFFARGMVNGINESAFVSTQGSSAPSLFGPIRQLGGSANIPNWALSDGAGTSASANVAYVINDAGNTNGLKGRFNISRPSAAAVQGHVITLIDSDPVTTLASGSKRPTATTTDAWLGNDSTSSDLTQNQLGIGGGTAINLHVGTVPGTAWVEQTTATNKLFTANLSLQAQGPFQDLASVSAPGLPVLNGSQATDNFNRANGGIGANWTQADGTWSISSNQVTYTLGGDSEASVVYTNLSFANDQYSQVTIATITNAVSGVIVRGASGANTGYAFACETVGSGTCFIFKVIAGAATNLVSAGSLGLSNGDVLRLEVHGTALTGFKNGTQVLTITDSAITSGSPGMWSENAATTTFDNWRGGDLNYSWTGHTVISDLYQTGTNCAAVGTAANPSVASCGAASAGSFSCATNASTGTCVVNTTAVTTGSEIHITQRADTTTGTHLSVTCNTGVSTVIPIITAVTAATSFTINLGTVAVNPECFSYMIVN